MKQGTLFFLFEFAFFLKKQKQGHGKRKKKLVITGLSSIFFGGIPSSFHNPFKRDRSIDQSSSFICFFCPIIWNFHAPSPAEPIDSSSSSSSSSSSASILPLNRKK